MTDAITEAANVGVFIGQRRTVIAPYGKREFTVQKIFVDYTHTDEGMIVVDISGDGMPRALGSLILWSQPIADNRGIWTWKHVSDLKVGDILSHWGSEDKILEIETRAGKVALTVFDGLHQANRTWHYDAVEELLVKETVLPFTRAPTTPESESA